MSTAHQEKPITTNGAGYTEGQPLTPALTAGQPGFPVYHRKLGNPGPLGLFSFASTTLILSLYNVSARHIAVPNLVVGMAVGVGGLVQLLAGMWEFACGNTFGATAFSSYGGFWISFALIFIPDSGIQEAYAGKEDQFHSALGIYLITWFVFTFIMFLATHKASVALASVFFFLFITFILLAAGEFTGKLNVHKAGGAFGIVTAMCAYYAGAAGLYTVETSYISLPVMSSSDDTMANEGNVYPTAGSGSTVNVNAPIFVPRGVASLLQIVTSASTKDTTSEWLPSGDNTQSHHLEESSVPGLSSTPINRQDAKLAADQPIPYSNANVVVAYSYLPFPLNHHLYASAISHPCTIDWRHRTYIPSSLRENLVNRSEALHSASTVGNSNVPDDVHTYHSLVPLGISSLLEHAEKRLLFGGWPTSVYKAINRQDGNTYALLRIEGYRLLHDDAFHTMEKWRQIQHPNVVTVKEAFTTRQFGDHSLVYVYEYHPGAQTLASIYLDCNATPIPEHILWSLIVQIALALREVHHRGLAVRVLEPSKILQVGKNRIKVNSCAIADVVGHSPSLGVDHFQQEDLLAFGRLIYSLGNRKPFSLTSPHESIEKLTQHYSPDLNHLAFYLVSKINHKRTIDDVLAKLASKALPEIAALESYVECLEHHSMGELENARLVRLLCKLAFINERPDFNHEPRWAETGDRYILKLFRDFIFHQVDDIGRPVVNMNHVLACLNKVDVGTEERIMLVSRDEQSCLVVSYKDVKHCIEQTFSELLKATMS
ncbi:PAB-dependent poly(A)-specific ribonuclease subunit 3 [Tulasnella sp. 403]|nr:PAB-dependent poly(A)-specific ribonuclease subunit 3 [Tulasnella sp. 403]